MIMPIPSSDPLARRLFLRAEDGHVSVESSEIEGMVMDLFDEFRNPMLRYVLAFGLPIYNAEEIIQEVFLALFRHLNMGKSRKNLRGWIFRVAHNLALKQRQANQRFTDVGAPVEIAAQDQIDPAPSPEEQILSRQRQNRLLRVLNSLPRQDQCCLRLRAEGFRYREIAEVLDISLGSVSVSIARSVARLMRSDEV
jgi:RNA polymerase sigma-70 factor, ECF subfamily